jgi:hypothetical protein
VISASGGNLNNFAPLPLLSPTHIKLNFFLVYANFSHEPSQKVLKCCKKWFSFVFKTFLTGFVACKPFSIFSTTEMHAEDLKKSGVCGAEHVSSKYIKSHTKLKLRSWAFRICRDTWKNVSKFDEF